MAGCLDGGQRGTAHRVASTDPCQSRARSCRNRNHRRGCQALEARRSGSQLLSGRSGLWCAIEPVGQGEGPIVALRADLDALPLPDTKDVTYRSTVAEVCHACGYDVQTAVLVGAGLALTHVPSGLPSKVRLIFQAAEELTPGGALDVLGAGCLEGVESIVGLHCDPHLDTGLVGLRTGPLTAAADSVEIRVSGPGGHSGPGPVSPALTEMGQQAPEIARPRPSRERPGAGAPVGSRPARIARAGVGQPAWSRPAEAGDRDLANPANPAADQELRVARAPLGGLTRML